MKHLIKKLLREELSTHDIDKMLNGLNQSLNCDGCKYFDMDNAKERFRGLELPLYFLLDKHEVHEITYLKPKQYIYTIANGFGLSYEDTLSIVSKENVTKYAEDMKKGDKFPLPYYKEGTNYQEGRHRALAAMKLGVKLIPVVKITKIKNSYIDEFISEYANATKEDLDKLFKEKGYDGVDQLGMNTFKRLTDNLNENKLNKDIVCDKCEWGWDKKDSEVHDMYICHKCGHDNEPK